MSSNTSKGGLLTWNDLCTQETVLTNRPSLLIGNGFSRNIWSDFKYQSLLEKARSENLLSSETNSLFTSLETEDFEWLLSVLAASKPVFAALKQDKKLLKNCEKNIRESLIKAVEMVHVPWSEIPKSTRQTIAKELKAHKLIYSTNYDLIVYWSIMTAYRDEFADYFWNSPFNTFNVLNTKEDYKGRSLIHYLHGGLHLFRDNDTVQTSKREHNGRQNILDHLKTNPNKTPLFISEGTSKDKLRSIRRSDYLSYVFSCFKNDNNPLIILGHRLADNDQHIVDAINAYRNRPVAISVRNSGNIDEKKERFKDALWNVNNLHFFDAATHPLLGQNLQVG